MRSACQAAVTTTDSFHHAHDGALLLRTCMPQHDLLKAVREHQVASNALS